MTNFDFVNNISNLTFDFGFTGEFSNFNFTDVSDGSTSYDFEFGITSVTVFRILLNGNNNFNSIWADPTSSLKNGRFYIGSENNLTIIQHNDGQAFIKDYFSKTVKGSTNETLDSENSVDINVTY